jgi:hypothetical protein
MDYHARPELSRSNIATFVVDGPRTFEAMHVTKTLPPPDETKDMVIGSLTHQQVLEPHLETGVVVIPREALNADGHRKGPAWTAFEKANHGKSLLKQSEYDEAMGCVFALRRKMSGLIESKNAIREQEIYWTHEATGLSLRAKLDLLVMDDGEWWLPDLKTSGDIVRFGREVEKRALWLQAAHYRAAVRAQYNREAHFWFCVVEKGGTNRVWHYELDEEALSLADQRWESALQDISSRLKSGDWSEWQEHGTNGAGTVILTKRDCFGWEW